MRRSLAPSLSGAPRLPAPMPSVSVAPLPSVGRVPLSLRPLVSTAPQGAVSCICKYYAAFSCKQSTKKHKTYEDGIIKLDGKQATLFDMEGKQVAREYSKLAGASTGSTLSIGRNDCEVTYEIAAAEFESGRVFLTAAPAVVAAVPAPLKSAAEDRKPAAAFKPFASRAQGLAAGVPTAHSREAGPEGGSMAADSSRLAGAGAPKPRHDPSARNALVLYTPPLADASSPSSAAAAVTVAVVVDPVLAQHLRPHQREGVRFLWQCVEGHRPGLAGAVGAAGAASAGGDGTTAHRGAILADDMGLGKTLQTIALIWTLLKQSTRPGVAAVTKALVVCPSSLVGNWRAEFKHWLTDERCRPLAVREQGAAAAAQVADFIAGSAAVHPVLIISYEMLRKHVAAIVGSAGAGRIGLLVCDEGHRLKSAAGSKMLDALNALPTPRRVILSGTPVQNNLVELYAMASFVNPGVLGALPAFRRVYQQAIAAGRDAGAGPAEAALAEQRSGELARQLAVFVLRRTGEVNAAFLPPKTETLVFVRLMPLQARLYAAVVASRLARSCCVGDGGGGGGDAAVLRVLHSLRKICMHPDLLLLQAQAQPSGTGKSGAAAAVCAAAVEGAINAVGRKRHASAFRADSADQKPAKRRAAVADSASNDEGSDAGSLRSFIVEDEASSSDASSEAALENQGDVLAGEASDLAEAEAVDANAGDGPACVTISDILGDLPSLLPQGYESMSAVALAAGGAAAVASNLDAALQFSSKLSFVDALLGQLRAAAAPRHGGDGGGAGGGGEKVVLVSNYTQVLDLLQALCVARGHAFCRLDGGTPADRRSDIVAAFNRPGSPTFVFLLSAGAGGVGLNLIGASRLVLLDASWNPAVDRQAMARVWRYGQRRPVHIYRLVAAHTLEEKILQRQLLKEGIATALGQGGGGGAGAAADDKSVSMRWSRDELRQLFSMDPSCTSAPCDTLRIMQRGGGGGAAESAAAARPAGHGGALVPVPVCAGASTSGWPPWTGAACAAGDAVLQAVMRGAGATEAAASSSSAAGGALTAAAAATTAASAAASAIAYLQITRINHAAAGQVPGEGTGAGAAGSAAAGSLPGPDGSSGTAGSAATAGSGSGKAAWGSATAADALEAGGVLEPELKLHDSQM